MELSHEDSLRLNVLLTQAPEAIRIDESKMVVYALTERGEASVALNPTGRDDQYLRAVRELLSTHALGSPGGYPVYLKRWTRMGQQRDGNSLQSLLLLGEPEAIVAVANTPLLSPELAALAWWAMPEADNARCMLAQPQVAASEVGREMAQYLIEYLPFETEPKAILDTVRLVLQPGLADEVVRDDLWKRAGRKGTFYIGFLQALPDALPETCSPHPEWAALQTTLAPLIEAEHAGAHLLRKVLSPEGQAFLKTVEAAMAKLADEASSVALFDVLGRYFAAAHTAAPCCRDSEAALQYAEACMADLASHAPHWAELLEAIPEQRDKLVACLTLAQAGEALLDSFFSHSDTVGPLMRRKLTPWTAPILEQIKLLRG
jgi:hypothetical protein